MAEPSSTPDTQDIRLWKARWDLAAPVLEKLRRRELRAMTEEEHRQSLVDVLDFELADDGRQHICGLAEFYRRWRQQ